jgi:hypothetical protein
VSNIPKYSPTGRLNSGQPTRQYLKMSMFAIRYGSGNPINVDFSELEEKIVIKSNGETLSLGDTC